MSTDRILEHIGAMFIGCCVFIQKNDPITSRFLFLKGIVFDSGLFEFDLGFEF